MSRYQGAELDQEAEHSHRESEDGNDPEGAPEPVFVGMAGTRRRSPQERPLIPRTLVGQPASVRVAGQGASIVPYQHRCYDRPDDASKGEDGEFDGRLV
jgi:hypothetical protein